METTTDTAVGYGKDDQVVWNNTLLTPDEIARFLKEYGEGPFKVLDVAKRGDRLMAQLMMPGGNAIRFEVTCFKKTSLSSAEVEH